VRPASFTAVRTGEEALAGALRDHHFCQASVNGYCPPTEQTIFGLLVWTRRLRSVQGSKSVGRHFLLVEGMRSPSSDRGASAVDSYAVDGGPQGRRGIGPRAVRVLEQTSQPLLHVLTQSVISYQLGGLRTSATTLGHAVGQTISRELRRNASTRTYQVECKASTTDPCPADVRSYGRLAAARARSRYPYVRRRTSNDLARRQVVFTLPA
jgi:hypothetical protein